MQSYNETPSGFGWKSSSVQKNSWVKGKENALHAPPCLQPGVQKPSLEKLVAQDTPRSRLPILSKTKEPPDFQKLHQSWQNQFQKGKAVKKKSCTRPQPFNFSQKGDRSQVATNTGQSMTAQANHRREPLAEVTLGQKHEESEDADVEGSSEEFKADPAALASILSNLGVPVAATGKLSLAQRVPMRGSSIAQSSNICKKMLVRSSMYAVLRSESSSSNLDRISCFSKMQTKARFPRSIMEDPGGQKPVFKQNPLLKSHVPDSSLRELVASNLDDELQSQENPVLQQMELAHGQSYSSVTSSPLRSREFTTVKSTPFTQDRESSALPADKCEKNTSEVDSCTGKRDLIKEGSASVEFVADLQALASILSNTGVSFGNSGKLSLAQRVPVQGKSLSIKSGMTTSGPSAMQSTLPKPCFGRMSTLRAPIKDIAFSPCRVPKTLMPDKFSSGSATRAHHNFSARFSQGYSVASKQPFFPKTPRALALEMANKKLESELSDTRPSIRSTVKWADEPSPMSETLCENEPKMEQVAVRLFLDGECPEEPDEEKEPAEESDRLKGSESLTAGVQKRMGATFPENSAGNADVAALAGVSQDLSVHTNVHPPAALSLSNAADHPVQYSSIMSCMKTSLPLSFLSHPAVQALQSRTLGPYTLPDIARLRIQAAVSAKQRFWETCLDEECAFYTSRGAISSYRNCIDPVSIFLDRQEDLHFTPIVPGEL